MARKMLLLVVPAAVCLSGASLPCRGADERPAEQPAGAKEAAGSPFFAMDTSFRHGDYRAPARQAEVLAALGFAGGDQTGTAGIAERLKAYDAKGLKLFGIYLVLRLGAGRPPYDPAAIKQAIAELKGRETLLWTAVQHAKYKPSDPAGDAEAIKAFGELAKAAAPAGLRVALYPHTGFWIERVEDAVRLAKKIDRPNVGATFNLCHFLRVDAEKNLDRCLRLAMPYLFCVTINGADSGGKDWAGLIQPLDSGSFDVAKVLGLLRQLRYAGPIGLQGYGIKGDPAENLKRSMGAWRRLGGAAGAGPAAPASQPTTRAVELLGGGDFSAFQGEVRDWTMAGEVFLDPADARKLAWRPGTAAAVNGPRGRAQHLLSRFAHGDCEAHVEFMISKGSNSGVYFQGRYELQVYDSHGVEKGQYPGIECGGIYPRWIKGKGLDGRSPRVNASRKPGEWQRFDVVFRAPRFDGEGRKLANARFVRVVHNGVVIHEDVELPGATRASAFHDEKPTGPLMLQGDHGPVAYRNIRLVARDLDAPDKAGAGGSAR